MLQFHVKIYALGILFFVGCSTNELPPCGDLECVDSCYSNADCQPGLTCQAFQNGEVRICAEPKAQTNNGTQTTSNNGQSTSTNNKIVENNGTTSQSTNTNSQSNNENNQTNNSTSSTNNGTTTPVIVKTSYTHFMIKDFTVGRGCTAISNAGPDPGSDIMWISLLDIGGQTIDYGNALNADDGLEENGHNNWNIINGSAPNTNTVGCTDAFNPTTVYSLGCGGTMIFRFSTSAFEGEHSVVIGEYGSTCGGSADDSYGVFACTNPQRAGLGDITSCNVRIGGNGEGIASFPLPDAP